MPNTTRDTVQVWLANYAAIAQPAQPGGPPPKVSEEEWAKMPAAERLDYCRRFPQSTDGGPRR
jgi:hypothetical protein